MAGERLMPGQMKQLRDVVRDSVVESLDIIRVLQPNIVDWRDGRPTIRMFSDTHAVDYDPSMILPAVYEEVNIEEVAAQYKMFRHAISLNKEKEGRLGREGFEAFRRHAINNIIDEASFNGSAVFLNQTVGSIDFTTEFAHNNVEWNFKGLGDTDPNQVGLRYNQVSEAESMLKSRGINTLGATLIAPCSLKKTLLDDTANGPGRFSFFGTGVPMAQYNDDILMPTLGLKTLWLTDKTVEKAGFLTDNIGDGNPGVYCYLVHGSNMYFVSNFGSEGIFGDEAPFKESGDVNGTDTYGIKMLYSLGGLLAKKNNVIRIKCRLSN